MQERARSYASERFCSGCCLSSHGVQVSRWDWLRYDDGATGNRRGLNYLCQLSQFVDSSESSITVAFRDIVARRFERSLDFKIFVYNSDSDLNIFSFHEAIVS